MSGVRDVNLTLAASALGAADTAAFLARRPQLFREAPGRAAGSVGFLALWVATGALAAREGRPGAAAVGLGALLTAGNAAMLGVHLKHRITSPRVFAGAALSGLALGGVLSRR